MAYLPLLLFFLAFSDLSGFSFPWSSSASIGNVATSRFHCVNASDPREGRCFFRDVYVVDHVVWVVRNETVAIPKVLCSAVDVPQAAQNCRVEWHPPKDLVARLTRKHMQLHSFDSGVVFSRLNPNNMYHAVMESQMPLFEIIHHTPELKDWLSPVVANASSRLLLFQEGVSNCHPGTELVHLLYPAVRFLEGAPDPHSVYHVKFLVAGTKASCVHLIGCQRGHFLTPDLGTLFRRYALHRAGLTAEARPTSAAPARVTVIQRTNTRRMANLAEVVAAVNDELAAQYGPNVRNATVVDFAAISLREQMRIALHTDVLIMVHGGVYGATLFLPRHAIVIDVYPYAFYPEQSGFHLNGIHLSMPSMHYGQVLLETNDSSSTVLVGKECYVGPCLGIHTTAPLHKAYCLWVDPQRLAQRLREALLAWTAAEPGATRPTPDATRAAAAVYAPPPTTAEFRVRAAAFTEAREASTLPSCDVRRPCDPSVLQRFVAGGDCPLDTA
eukprot:EG_transcript_1193